LARASEPGTHGDEPGDVLTVDYRDLDRLAGLVAAAGTDAYVLEPPALTAAVVSLLRAAAGVSAHGVETRTAGVGTGLSEAQHGGEQ
jgi:predicted DNA-binding transcriptional regulator YafY